MTGPNSCFFLYAEKQILVWLIKAEFIVNLDESFTAIPIDDF